MTIGAERDYSPRLGVPLRVATFNAQLLPHMVSCGRRARLLADNIIAGGYDLISLNEVFSNRARRILLERLRPHYPCNITMLRGSRKWRLDSGLMLFSKLPFQSLSDIRDFIPGRAEVIAGAAGDGNACVRFDEYNEYCCSDGLASKGAAYVKLTVADRPLHVFMTHVQASYLDHSVAKYLKTVEARAAQLRQMAAFMRSVAGTDALRRENTLILGDLNVHWSSTGAGYAHAGARLHGDEWDMMFEALGPLFEGTLADVWQRSAPREDAGPTFPAHEPATRPDYILLSAADAALPLCVQHVSVARQLAEDSGAAGDGAALLSDHMGLRADLNLAAPHCSLNDAHDIRLDGSEVRVDGQICHPGGVQWYRFSTPGKYRMRIAGLPQGARLQMELYSRSDISQPLVCTEISTSEETTTEFSMVDPSYVRVGDPRHSTPLNYTMYLSRSSAAP
jgi:endonuclease/exonuclease/phosphatase family metal-dependent hydrolase